MLVTTKLHQLYVRYLQSVLKVEGYFFIDSTEALSMMLKGMDFDAEGIFADTSGGSKQLKKLKKLSGAKGIWTPDPLRAM